MNRISIIQDSKFNRISKKDMDATKGGICISCRKRERKVDLGLSVTVVYEKVSATIS